MQLGLPAGKNFGDALTFFAFHKQLAVDKEKQNLNKIY